VKPPVSRGGLNTPTTHIYHLFRNGVSDVMFLKR
jgi:hypothetical protein